MKNAKTSGYSLIEVVIYTAILASLTIFVANTVLLSFSSLKNARINRKINLSAETALERLIRESRLARSVDNTLSVLGSNPSTLVLESVASAVDATPSSKSFFISGGRLAFQKNGGEIKFLTAPNIYVSSFLVSKTESLHSEAVKINLILESSESASPVSRSFYISAVLRGGY